MVSPLYQRYEDFEQGTINVANPARIPINSVYKSQNIRYQDGWWKKLPGLAEINGTPIGSDPVWSYFVSHQINPAKAFKLSASGAKVLLFNEQTNTFDDLMTGLTMNKQIEFVEFPPFVYFGSQYDLWRRFDGGTVTYSVGGDNGNASDAPRKFSQIILNPYSQRFFGIGDLTDPDKLRWSNHLDDGGIEVFPESNNQIIESVNGDYPLWMDIFEGRINIFNRNSIHSADVTGVPEVWSFQREKSQTGTIARRTVKRWGNRFLMLSPSFDVYVWPDDVFITKEKIRFDINPHKAHLACAEIVEDRYYYLLFESGDATSNDNYHLWIYDLIGKRWSGPHIRFNAVSMFWDKDTNLLMMGGGGQGTGNLNGFVLEHRGRNIKGRTNPVHWMSSYSDYGKSRTDKRYTKFYMTTSQEGVLPGGSGQLEVIVNTDGLYNNPQSQRLTLVDGPTPNNNVTDTGGVRTIITKRGHIQEAYGKGNRIQIEIKHDVSDGDFAFSDFDIEYLLRTNKENRGV